MSATTTSTAVAINNAAAAFSDADLAMITDFQSAIDKMNELNIVPESMSDYGTGFEIAKDKSNLVGVPFLILDWRFNKSDHSDERPFVSAAIVTKDGRKLILNDGGTGICEQLTNVTAQREAKNHPTPQSGLIVKDGLTRSDYSYVNDNGKTSQATTFYLSE